MTLLKREATTAAMYRRHLTLLLPPRISGQALPAYGTTVLINLVNEAGALPTQNSAAAASNSRKQ